MRVFDDDDDDDDGILRLLLQQFLIVLRISLLYLFPQGSMRTRFAVPSATTEGMVWRRMARSSSRQPHLPTRHPHDAPVAAYTTPFVLATISSLTSPPHCQDDVKRERKKK